MYFLTHIHIFTLWHHLNLAICCHACRMSEVKDQTNSAQYDRLIIMNCNCSDLLEIAINHSIVTILSQFQPCHKKQQLKKPTTQKRAYIQYGLSRKTASTVFIPVLIRVFHCDAIIVYYITKTRPCNIQRLFFSKAKIENIGKCLIFFNISAQNILRGYMFEPPRRGGCIECPQCTSVVTSAHNVRNKIRYTPANPSFSI